MSDDTADAGGRLWARPEAPDLSGNGRPNEPWPNLEPAAPPAAQAPAPGPRQAPELPVWWIGFAAVVAGYAVAIVVVGLLAAITGTIEGPAITIGGTYLQDAALFVVAFFFARAGKSAGGLAVLGWRRTGGLGRGFLMAAGVALTFYLVSGIYGQLVGIDDASEDTVDALGLKTGNARLVFSAILLTLVAPIVEETVFRGLLFGALWRWKGWVFGAIVSGIVFGGIHAGGAPVEALPVLAFLGFGLAFLYWYTGSLIAPVGLHAFNNSLTLAITVEWAPAAQVALVVGAPGLAMLIVWALAPDRSVPART